MIVMETPVRTGIGSKILAADQVFQTVVEQALDNGLAVLSVGHTGTDYEVLTQDVEGTMVRWGTGRTPWIMRERMGKVLQYCRAISGLEDDA